MNARQREARRKTLRAEQKARTQRNRVVREEREARRREDAETQQREAEEDTRRYDASQNTPAIVPEVCIPEVLPPETEGERAAKDVITLAKMMGMVGWTPSL